MMKYASLSIAILISTGTSLYLFYRNKKPEEAEVKILSIEETISLYTEMCKTIKLNFMTLNKFRRPLLSNLNMVHKFNSMKRRAINIFAQKYKISRTQILKSIKYHENNIHIREIQEDIDDCLKILLDEENSIHNFPKSMTLNYLLDLDNRFFLKFYELIDDITSFLNTNNLTFIDLLNDDPTSEEKINLLIRNNREIILTEILKENQYSLDEYSNASDYYESFEVCKDKLKIGREQFFKNFLAIIEKKFFQSVDISEYIHPDIIRKINDKVDDNCVYIANESIIEFKRTNNVEFNKDELLSPKILKALQVFYSHKINDYRAKICQEYNITKDQYLATKLKYRKNEELAEMVKSLKRKHIKVLTKILLPYCT